MRTSPAAIKQQKQIEPRDQVNVKRVHLPTSRCPAPIRGRNKAPSKLCTPGLFRVARKLLHGVANLFVAGVEPLTNSAVDFSCNATMQR